MNSRQGQHSYSKLRVAHPEPKRSFHHNRKMSAKGDNENYASNKTGSVSVSAPISAIFLRSVNPVEFDKFLKERELYELEVETKKPEVLSTTVRAFKAGIDRSLLNNLF